MITWPCPVCGERLSVSDGRRGQTFVCPLCGTESRIPREHAANEQKVAGQSAAEGKIHPAAAEAPDPAMAARVAELEALQQQRGLSTEELRELAGHHRTLGNADRARQVEVALKARAASVPASTTPMPDERVRALLADPRMTTRTVPDVSLPDVSLARILGGLVLAGGLLTVGYYLLVFDPSVEVPRTYFMGEVFGGDRVNNLGRLQDQQNGIIIGCIAVLAGLLLLLLGGRRQP